MRLNKYLALHRGISRREADELIAKRRVKINDAVAELGAQVGPGDSVTIDNQPVATSAEYRYLALHKPTNYVCSRRQQGGSPTIYALLPPELHALKPVGRLDRDSSGLLLMTNDGDFAHRMTHPSFHKTKIYYVTLDQPLQPLHQQMISDFGVMLEDGKSRFIVEKSDHDSSPRALQAHIQSDQQIYKVTMHEGRNRQIRRTFSALGYTVTTLHRDAFGNYALGDIPSGSYQDVDMR